MSPKDSPDSEKDFLEAEVKGAFVNNEAEYLFVEPDEPEAQPLPDVDWS